MTSEEVQETPEFEATLEWLRSHGPKCDRCLKACFMLAMFGLAIDGCAAMEERSSQLRAMMRGAS